MSVPSCLFSSVECRSYHRGSLIAQCAESKVYECCFYGFPAICKHRFEKEYRHPKLDLRLREQRTTREARALARCALAGVRVPAVLAVHPSTGEIIMERIFGVTVKSFLDNAVESSVGVSYGEKGGTRSGEPNLSLSVASTATGSSALAPTCTPSSCVSSSALPPLVFQILEGIGEVVGSLHQLGMVHGDLTTSNFIYSPISSSSFSHKTDFSFFSSPCAKNGRGNENTGATGNSSAKSDLVVIDFGLINEKSTAEDRAVDLYVLLRAFSATHPSLESVAEECILQGYCRNVACGIAKATLSRLEVVRARGRKRSMVG